MRGWLASLIVIAAGVGPAWAQDPLPPSFELHRYEEDWRAWCTATQPQTPERLKCLTVGDATLTLGGDLRERVEVVRNPGFGLEQDAEHVFLHRAMLHADLRIGDDVRAFVQLGAFDANGREASGPPTDRNALDVTQAFLDVSTPFAGARATLRAGRQEVSFGSSRLVAVRDGPNVRRAFDGARLSTSASDVRIDAFYLRPITVRPGVLDDRTSGEEALSGVYATTVIASPLHVDLYYLNYRRDDARFAIGTADERRHSLGARLFGASAGFDWDVEGVVQFGRFGSSKVAAWTIASNFGVTLADVPLKPRFGMKADIASGDNDASDRTLGTFNALYPKFPYSRKPIFLRRQTSSISTPASALPHHQTCLWKSAGMSFGGRQRPTRSTLHPSSQ